MNRKRKNKKSEQGGKNIILADILAKNLLDAREESREAMDYNKGMLAYAQILNDISRNGTLAEKIEAEITLQERDLEHAESIGSVRLVREAKAAMVDFKAGLVVYDRLTRDPKQYRNYAEGFMTKHRLLNGVPKDELHNVLKSQISRETIRDSSRHNTTGEEALVAARKVLIAAILDDYTRVQEVVVGGGEPPEGTVRSRFNRAK